MGQRETVPEAVVLAGFFYKALAKPVRLLPYGFKGFPED